MRAAWLIAALAAACSHAQKAEESLALPPYPSNARLIEFLVAPTSEFRFFVDPAAVRPGSDGVVRYTLVARSNAGAENVSYEGLRCASADVRIYALGREGGWVVSRADWRPVRSQWHIALYREYFCPLKEPIATRDEGIEALRHGGYSITRSLNEDIPRGGGAR